MARERNNDRGTKTDRSREQGLALTQDTRNGSRRTQRSARSSSSGERHEHRIAKVVELVGSSPTGFEDAVQVAIQGAAETTRGITGAQVTAWSVKCDDGEIVEYKATVKVAFGVERT